MFQRVLFTFAQLVTFCTDTFTFTQTLSHITFNKFGR